MKNTPDSSDFALLERRLNKAIMDASLRGLTKSELCKRMSTSMAQLNRTLQPVSFNTSLDSLKKLAGALEMDLDIRLVRRRE